MTASVDRPAVLVNPLPITLAHYQAELSDTLARVGIFDIEIISESGDGQSGSIGKAKAAWKIISSRIQMAFRYRERKFIVLWPIFGYFDILTWLFVGQRNQVFIIVHDPTPLRAQVGHSGFAKKIYRWMSAHSSITSVCHTQFAARELLDQVSVRAVIASHPISEYATNPWLENDCKAVRVLGQYKEARTVSPLVDIVRGSDPGGLAFQIHGRNWPAVAGWEVVDKFLPEDEFDTLVKTSKCVVVPYAQFFQSGVAARAFEAGVPIVAPRHEHIEELYGRDWPGIVRDPSDWPLALQRVLNLDFDQIADRRKETIRTVDLGWAGLMRSPSKG